MGAVAWAWRAGAAGATVLLLEETLLTVMMTSKGWLGRHKAASCVYFIRFLFDKMTFEVSL